MQRPSKLSVRKMTPGSRRRRQSDGVFRFSLTPALLCLFCLPVSNTGIAESRELQPIADISAAAEAYLLERLDRSDEHTTVHAGQLDSRLQLANCDIPLEAFMRRGAKIGNRTVIGVRCSGVKPWKVYLPVDIVVTRSVLVLRQTLPRGHVLGKDDLLSEQRDVGRLVGGYITNPGELLGQRLKHPLVAGRVITSAMVQADRVIRRGQSVTLTVQSTGLSIRMSGKALSDGAIGQRVRVENSNSGRIVEGIVRSPEHVEILIYSKNNFSHAKPKESAISADNKG